MTDVEVIDDPAWERISVFVEDELGRDWEYAWTGTWTWTQL